MSEYESAVTNPRKRKRVGPSRYRDHKKCTIKLASSAQANKGHGDRGKRVKRPCLAYISPPNMTYPKSLYNYWQPLQTPTSESLALRDILKASKSRAQRSGLELGPESDDNDNDKNLNYTLVHLSDFRVYRPERGVHGSVMRPLNDLATRRGDCILLFDGVLTLGTVSHYVQGVPFETLAMDGYGTRNLCIVNQACIQSDAARALNVWYLLGDAASDYQCYHCHFSWIADFTKHFVGFLHDNDNVRLADFRYRFYKWLHTDYGNNEIFKNWLTQYGGNTDFRTVVAANVEYLWKEAVDVRDGNRNHFIWKEVDWNQLKAVHQQDSAEKKTIVTPFVYECFKGIYFADQLELRPPCKATYEKTQSRKAALGFGTNHGDANIGVTARDVSISAINSVIDNLRVGDVIGIETEARDQTGPWANDAAKLWYGYIQHIKQAKDKRDILHVIWLYQPPQTTCQDMYYPISNEMFFSDDCNCKETAKIYADEVKTVLSIELFASSPNQQGKYFVRNTYLSDEQSFVTMNKSHLRCNHHSDNFVTDEEVSSKFQPGQTVLVKLECQEFLEPVEIVEYVTKKKVRVRKLLRRNRDLHENQAWPNELVETTEIFIVAANQIIQICHVRYYSSAAVASGQVPPPYSYGGVGNFWIITSQLSHVNGQQKLVELQKPYPTHLRQGFDPCESPSVPWLRSMDLFSGGGSFGRGIEVCGIVKLLWAVDYDAFAAHTYRANCSHPEDANVFLGSVCDYLAQALAGKFSIRVARVGDVDFIIIGSPCQGFSDSQPDKSSSRSRKNASMIAQAVAFIDLYRPKYAIFENVFGMTRSVGEDNVLAQLICSLVAMGYQVTQFPADAFNYGCPQNRLRVFISNTAPGLQPLSCPPHTHSTPSYIKTRRFGKTMSGMDIGVRQFNFTPFKYITANEATKNLPIIGDGAANSCISYPDHRVSLSNRLKTQIIIRCIARYPRSSNWVKTIAQNRMPAWVLEQHKDKGQSITWTATSNKAFTRVNPDGLFDTVMTGVGVGDAKNGKWLHWDQHRMISIMEARRAQSYPDNEVLIGRPSDQWKILGNSVARYVAVAIGLELREAYLATAALQVQKPVTAAFTTKETALSFEESAIGEEQEFSESNSDVDSDTMNITTHGDNCIQIKAKSLSAGSRQQNLTRKHRLNVVDRVTTVSRTSRKPFQRPPISVLHIQSLESELKNLPSKPSVSLDSSYPHPMQYSADDSLKGPEHSRDRSKLDEPIDIVTPRSIISKVLDYFPSNMFGGLTARRQTLVKGKSTPEPNPMPFKSIDIEVDMTRTKLRRPRKVYSNSRKRKVAVEGHDTGRNSASPNTSHSEPPSRYLTPQAQDSNDQNPLKEINNNDDSTTPVRVSNREPPLPAHRPPSPAPPSAQTTLHPQNPHTHTHTHRHRHSNPTDALALPAAKSPVSIPVPVITPPSSPRGRDRGRGTVSCPVAAPQQRQRQAAAAAPLLLHPTGPTRRSRFAKVRGRGSVVAGVWDVE